MSLKKTNIWLLSLLILTTFIAAAYYLQKDISIYIDGKQKQQVYTYKKTVDEVLKEANITVSSKDKVTPQLDAFIADKQSIKIIRAVPVSVIADGSKVHIDTIPVSVKEILKKANVALGSYDYPSKSLEAVVVAGDIIKVTRVKKVYEKRKVVLEFTEERRPDPSLEKGITKMLRKGTQGLAEKTICITYEDGKEVSRGVVENKVIKKPKSRLIAMGTISSVSRSGKRFDFDRAVVVEATAYTHTGNRTATGVYPEVGTVAVDPGTIPLGSKLYIEGYGFARAQDVGGAIKGNRIDVFMDTENAARKWGRRNVKAYVLK